MNICFDDNRHLRKFFEQNAQAKAEIMVDLQERLPQLLDVHNGKIKPVNHAKHEKQRVLEYKIIVPGNTAYRVAFTVVKETINVIFISSTIIKAQFCKLLNKTNLLD